MTLSFYWNIFFPRKCRINQTKRFLYIKYLNSFANFKFSEESKFYSSLSDKHSSSEDYEHILKVWKAFKIENLEECNYLYLHCYVL